MGRVNPLVALAIPSWGKVSLTWARAYRHLGGPLGSTTVELEPIIGEPIAKARNTLMAQAIAANAEFLYFHGDDVLAPGNMLSSMLQRMRAHPDIDLLTGVYWTREWPTSPYLWRGMQRGPFFDWKLGEFLTVDYAGCDALMIRLSDRVKALGPDWFSTTWLWTEDQEAPSDIATEDFYFYTRARFAGIKLWCDTSLQCIHEDRTSGMQFGLTTEMPQAGGVLPALPDPAEGSLVKIADIGAGGSSPFFGQADQVSVTRIDLDESKHPDIRADIRSIPVPDGAFDVVHSRHALEHFGRAEIVPLLTEWVRILRIGGELRINVPNLTHAIEQILLQDAGEAEPHPYAWWQVYGEQADERDIHKNGYTARRLKLLLEMPCFGLDDVTVVEAGGGLHLQATATKARVPARYALTPAWDAIAEAEGIIVPGIAPKADEEPLRKTAAEAKLIESFKWRREQSNGHVSESAVTPEAAGTPSSAGAAEHSPVAPAPLEGDFERLVEAARRSTERSRQAALVSGPGGLGDSDE